MPLPGTSVSSPRYPFRSRRARQHPPSAPLRPATDLLSAFRTASAAPRPAAVAGRPGPPSGGFAASVPAAHAAGLPAAAAAHRADDLHHTIAAAGGVGIIVARLCAVYLLLRVSLPIRITYTLLSPPIRYTHTGKCLRLRRKRRAVPAQMICQGVTVGHSFRLKGAASAANGKADVCASCLRQQACRGQERPLC